MTPEATYWRQLDILHPNQMRDARVTLIGAGGIGSPTALCLAKMGIGKMAIYDQDGIEEHNLPNQFYPQDGVGHYKALILGDMLHSFSEVHLDLHTEKYEDQPLSGIVISAVDSMATRRTIWEGVNEYRSFIKLYIEARMGAEVGMVYTFDPNDLPTADWYVLHQLYHDTEAMQLPCTATAIIYNTMMIASLIARQVKNYLTGGWMPRELVMDMNTLAILRSDPR